MEGEIRAPSFRPGLKMLHRLSLKKVAEKLTKQVDEDQKWVDAAVQMFGNLEEFA
jgi:hypothetical protein